LISSKPLILMATPIAIIAGVGPGTGRALALKFASAYPVLLLARSSTSVDPIVAEIRERGGTAFGVPVDVADRLALEAALAKVKEQDGFKSNQVAAAVFNVGGKFIRKPFLEFQGAEEWASAWESFG